MQVGSPKEWLVVIALESLREEMMSYRAIYLLSLLSSGTLAIMEEH